jgi:hypothetical protein
MTQEMCYDLVRAAGYKYAAVQAIYHCFGGNDISKYVTPAGEKCDSPCGGNAAQNCGGPCVNRIFKVPQGKLLDCAGLESGHSLNLIDVFYK